MNRMEICAAARQFAGELAGLGARGDVNSLLSPDNLLMGERSVSLRNDVPPPPGPLGIYPGFSAPEVYMGQAGPASGVYFVGAVVYLLMFGSPPPDARARAGAPAIPNAQDPLSQLVNAAMEPDPAMRIGSFTALQNALAGIYARMQAALPPQQPAFTPPAPQGMTQPSAFAPPPPPVQPQAAARQSAFAPPAPPVQSQAAAQPSAFAPPPQPAQPQAAARPSAFAPPPPPVQPQAAARPSAFVPPPPPVQPQAAAQPSAFVPTPPPVQPQAAAQPSAFAQPAQPQVTPLPSAFAPPSPAAPQGMAARPMPQQGMAPRPPVPPPPRKKKKHTGLKIGIIAAALVVVLGGGFAGYTVYQQGEAEKAYGDSEWEAYQNAMDAAPWLKSDENAPQYDYCTARLLEADGDTDGALELYDELADFEDCVERANVIRYDTAVALMDSGELEDSLDAFLALGEYSDSAEYAYNLEAYLAADALEDTLDRYYAFGDLYGFLDSDEKAEECVSAIYDEAVALYEDSSFSEAQGLFDAIIDYENADRYSYACSMAEDYYYSNLAEYEALEQEGIAVGHIMLSDAYYQAFFDGIWDSSDGGGDFLYYDGIYLGDSFAFSLGIEDASDSSYEYENGVMSPVSGEGDTYSFTYIDFNTLEINISSYGTFTFERY